MFIWLNAFVLIILLILGVASGEVIVIAFFLETIIIGLIHALKMTTSIRFWNNSTYKSPKNNHFGFVLFFLFHYGFFIAVQLIFVFAILQVPNVNFEPFNIIQNLDYAINLEGMYWVLSSMLFFNLMDYMFNFIKNLKYQSETVDSLFMQPYKRIFIQQFAVILGSFFIGFKSAIVVVAILLIIFKSMVDFIFVSSKLNP